MEKTSDRNIFLGWSSWNGNHYQQAKRKSCIQLMFSADIANKTTAISTGKTSENLSILSVDVQHMPCGISASFFLHWFSSLNTSRLHKVAMEITARS